ncbi:hypothetical protein ACFLIM_32820 [Nonomuraea sp. M3C6]|uniref:Endonuclease/Exonuclease/phosphatase family protein n=1 Tax=Nonomuraea marmarensis TaxID=3351344 RepID=A0ABW7AKV6_9ACTN
MRRSTINAALVAAALGTMLTAPPALSDADGREVRLRVATYNIHAGGGQDGRFDLARHVYATLSRSETRFRAVSWGFAA